MHIIYDGIIYSLQSSGGITRYANELITRIAEPDREVAIIMHRPYYNEPPEAAPSTVLWVSNFPTLARNKLLKYLVYPFDQYSTNRFLAKQKITHGIFHSTYFTHYPSLTIPQVVTVHDLILEKMSLRHSISERLFLYHKKKVINAADAIICISEQTARDVVEYYSVDKSKITVIHHGVSECFSLDTDQAEQEQFFLSFGVPQPYLLFVGKRSFYKNFSRLLQAFAQWPERNNYVIVVVGGGPLSKQEKVLINELKLDKKIINFDFVPDRTLKIFYQRAAAFIYPSLYEGFGMPLLEAMACGTLTLAADIPVFHELGGTVPLYLNPYEIDSITQALDKVLIRKDRYHERLRAGLELARSFTWDNTATKTAALYERLFTSSVGP